MLATHQGKARSCFQNKEEETPREQKLQKKHFPQIRTQGAELLRYNWPVYFEMVLMPGTRIPLTERTVCWRRYLREIETLNQNARHELLCKRDEKDSAFLWTDINPWPSPAPKHLIKVYLLTSSGCVQGGLLWELRRDQVSCGLSLGEMEPEVRRQDLESRRS